MDICAALCSCLIMVYVNSVCVLEIIVNTSFEVWIFLRGGREKYSFRSG